MTAPYRRFPTIMCARCGKPVECLDVVEDFVTFEKVLTAFCHGQTDVMRFSPERLSPDVISQMQYGVGLAFANDTAVQRFDSALKLKDETQ